MIQDDLLAAIHDRLLDGTDWQDLDNNDYVNRALSNAHAPYIVLTIQSNTGNHHLDKDRFEVVVNVHVFVEANSTSIADPFERLQSIKRYAYGNAVENGGSPTYGLHRWKPTLDSAAWEATSMVCVDEVNNDEENYYHRTLVFRVNVSK